MEWKEYIVYLPAPPWPRLSPSWVLSLALPAWEEDEGCSSGVLLDFYREFSAIVVAGPVGFQGSCYFWKIIIYIFFKKPSCLLFGYYKRCNVRWKLIFNRAQKCHRLLRTPLSPTIICCFFSCLRWYLLKLYLRLILKPVTILMADHVQRPKWDVMNKECRP